MHVVSNYWTTRLTNTFTADLKTILKQINDFYDLIVEHLD